MTRYAYFDKIQKAFLGIVTERVKELGLKSGEFAFMVWPEAPKKTAENRWNVLRNKSPNTGKPQSLLLVDAFRMAEALNENVTYLIGKAAEKAAAEVAAEITAAETVAEIAAELAARSSRRGSSGGNSRRNSRKK